MVSANSSSVPSTMIIMSSVDSMINTRVIWRWDIKHARMELVWVEWINQERVIFIRTRVCAGHLLGDLHGSSGKSRLPRNSGRMACNRCSFESRSNRLPVRCFWLIVYRAFISSFQCGHRFQSPTLSSEISAIDTCKKRRNWLWSVISLLF